MKLTSVFGIFLAMALSVGCAKKSISVIPNGASKLGGGGGDDPTVRPATGYSPTPLNFRQITGSLIAMAGITDAVQIADIEAEADRHKAQFPKTGTVEEVTSTSMNAAFFLASKVCDYIKSSPGLPTITATSSATSTPSENVAVNTAGNFYAQKFLGRDLSADEISVFLNLKRTGGLTTPALHQMMCTIIASSAESLSM